MASTPPERLLGTVVDGRFRVDELIGSGQMAHVYIAEQLSMGRKIALKLLREELSLDEGAAARFRREVTAVNRLQSPHTIRFHDFGETAEGLLFIAMELLSGESLRDHLERSGAMQPAATITILDQVAHSLDEAHAAGVIHRDLKPENVHLYTDTSAALQPFVKVLDFGLARMVDGVERITGPNTTVGSPAYIAPEMIIAGRTPDYRGDLYALGVTAFEMLVGRLPYAETEPHRMALAHASHPPPAPTTLHPALPAAVDDVMASALAKEPEERFQSAAALTRALGQALGLDIA